jgi:hypothetical protein
MQRRWDVVDGKDTKGISARSAEGAVVLAWLDETMGRLRIVVCC